MDGKPYIKYKVGADTVDLKLGEPYMPTFVCGFYSANISYMDMIVDVDGYKELHYKARATGGGGGRTYKNGVYTTIPTIDTEYVVDVSVLKSFSIQFQSLNPQNSTVTVHDVVRV